MKKIHVFYMSFLLFSCIQNKKGIQVDVIKKNDIISISYTNFSDTIYIVNGILFDIVEYNKNSKHNNSNESVPSIYNSTDNDIPKIRNFFYETNKAELYLQKVKDSIYRRSKSEDYYPFENILIIYPRTTKTVFSKIKINKESQKFNLKVTDFHELNYIGRDVFEQISPVLKDVNKNYYLYKYRFNTRSNLKINLK